jgi:hypothetical protein
MADSLPQFGSWLRIGRWLALGLLLHAAALRAGDLPVFRCALENWPARDYQAVIFHRGPLGMDDQDLVTAMKEAPQRWGANIATSTADVLEQMDEATLALWKTQTNAEPPWMVVLAPPNDDYSPVLWAGRFGADTVKAVLDSPARKKTIEALVRGDSAVWVLLECGDAMRDEAAVDTLAGTLKRLETDSRLSASITSAPPVKFKLPLRVAFSLVRVTRNDPAEEFFVNLLSHGERFHPGKPAAFPVFGRGRALSAIAGKHLDDDFILDACSFITGACSNGVKELRPGKDLLLCVRWDSIFEEATSLSPQSTTTNPPAASVLALAKTPATQAQPSIEETVGRRPAGRSPGATAVMIGLVAVAAFILWRIRRRT